VILIEDKILITMHEHGYVGSYLALARPLSVAGGAITPVERSPPAMGNRHDHDSLADKFVNNRVGELPHDHAATRLVILRLTQRTLGNYPETAFNLALEISGY